MEANFEIPFGYRFRPTKEELFQFLWLKVNGQPLLCGEGVIGELDVYDERQLEEIFLKGEREGGPVYMFTRLKNKGKSGNKNKIRRVGQGTWKGTQQRKKLEGHGVWRDFRYENFKSKRHHHKWNMTEFYLDENRYPDLQDYAISRVKRKENQARDKKENQCKEQHTQQENEEEEERPTDDSFAQYLERALMSDVPESETGAVSQDHNETMQIDTSNTELDTVSAFMEKPTQIVITNAKTNDVSTFMEGPLQTAITNTDTNVVSALIEEPLQVAITNTNTNVVSALVEGPLQTTFTNTNTDIGSAFIEEPNIPAGDPDNFYAELEKALSSNAFVESFEKTLMSLVQVSETGAILQDHNEAMQIATTNTNLDTVLALREEGMQVAVTNIETNVVSALIEEPMQTAITNTGTSAMSTLLEKPLQEAITNTDPETVFAFIEEPYIPDGDQLNYIFAEAEKALSSDDLNSMSWIDEMLARDNEIGEHELLPLADGENEFFPYY